jgi:hypothetical protein
LIWAFDRQNRVSHTPIEPRSMLAPDWWAERHRRRP